MILFFVKTWKFQNPDFSSGQDASSKKRHKRGTLSPGGLFSLH
ncbi:hypothetical protein M23134_01856 [Microscilla marina ATCC 23134]|uniref:Uncharacterized protein n=1 Tax=Microscilla marina ATCC 23134 TaxID=313606 RepID=A1ZC25_MICM2|nr:hypothetical protein M23134_01856 [Microscilla marina ATCC 23134]